MEKNFEQCVAIKFWAKFSFTAAKTSEMVTAVYGESAVLFVTVKC